VSTSWQDWGPSQRIRVDGGVRAKSKRGSIGQEWWSRRFIAVLESYGMSGRLSRGRSYARSGQVVAFTLAPGTVTAQVQGSRPKPYKVRIGVPALSGPQWRRVEQRLASQALFRAKLLAGEMPHEIEEVFADCGTPLFPEDLDDLDLSCNCPDWGLPCKHLAALCYVLAEAFDEDPFKMLAWRGKDREELLAALRAAAPTAAQGPAAGSAAAAAADLSAVHLSTADSGGAIAVDAPPLEDCLDHFWSGGLSPARLRALTAPAGPATAPDLLLRMFEPPPVQVRGKDLADVLAPAYDHLATPDPE
jgi:uncharacterized Zn finger protein